MIQGYSLSNYLSAYEGDALISIHHSIYGDICHGIPYEEIRNQSWYRKYENEYVISFKVIKDKDADNQIVLLLLM